jgi:ATP-dependent Clp protease, protease subunit
VGCAGEIAWTMLRLAQKSTGLSPPPKGRPRNDGKRGNTALREAPGDEAFSCVLFFGFWTWFFYVSKLYRTVNKGEILIYDIIGGDYYYGYGVTANSIMNQLKPLNADKDVTDITVRINSPGGSIGEGIAIFNMLQRNSKPVNTVVDGVAYSMAAVIAMAGKERSMAKNATLMLHCCSGWGVGNARDLMAQVEMMKAIDTGLSESIAESSGLTVDQVKEKWMNYDDHTFTAREAKDAKLIDVVLDMKGDVPADIANMSTTDMYAYFSKKNGRMEQDNFIERVAHKIGAQVKSIFTPAKATNNENTMNFEKTIAALKAGSSDAERTAALAELEAFTNANEKFTRAELDVQISDAVKAAGATSETTVTALKAKHTEEVTALGGQVSDLQAKLNAAAEEISALKGPAKSPGKPVAEGADANPLTEKKDEEEIDSTTKEAILRAKKFGNGKAEK